MLGILSMHQSNTRFEGCQNYEKCWNNAQICQEIWNNWTWNCGLRGQIVLPSSSFVGQVKPPVVNTDYVRSKGNESRSGFFLPLHKTFFIPLSFNPEQNMNMGRVLHFNSSCWYYDHVFSYFDGWYVEHWYFEPLSVIQQIWNLQVCPKFCRFSSVMNLCMYV